MIVLIQNGINIEKPFLSRFPDNCVLSGVSRIDAHQMSPSVIEQKQPDKLHIGAFHNSRLSSEAQQAAAEHFVKIYSAGGRTTCLHQPDVQRDRWRKLVYNATFNPVCALTDVNTGDLQLEGTTVKELVIPAMKEVLQVLQAKGYAFPESIIDETIRSNPIDQKIAPSMQKDVEKVCSDYSLKAQISTEWLTQAPRQGNFLEHENILGEVIREGQATGVPTPILSTLYALCNSVQGRMKRAKGLA